ncbi:uncharacterized protein [Narcine bancroftii]|uniref:uncharacterized protein isoform X2 n=1 Tax=Narcine bancroftii TaxID=1343680 RepID=UPI0038320074
MSLSGTSKACSIGHLKSQRPSHKAASGRTMQSDLRRHYYTISMSMSLSTVEQISYSLYSAQILTQHEVNVITSKTEVLSKASELLSAVLRKGISTSNISQTSLFRPPSYLVQPPVVCKICICNSSLNNCTFGSGNTVSVMTTEPLSSYKDIKEPPTSRNQECGNPFNTTSQSHMCSISNNREANFPETIENDIKISRSKLRNVTVGESNDFTMVEEFSNEDDSGVKELEEELEENDGKDIGCPEWSTTLSTAGKNTFRNHTGRILKLSILLVLKWPTIQLRTST